MERIGEIRDELEGEEEGDALLMGSHDDNTEDDNEEEEEVLIDGFVGECNGNVVDIRNVEIDIAPAAAGGEIAVLRPRLEVALDGDGGRNQTAHQTVEALHTSSLNGITSGNLDFEDNRLQIDVNPNLAIDLHPVAAAPQMAAAAPQMPVAAVELHPIAAVARPSIGDQRLHKTLKTAPAVQLSTLQPLTVMPHQQRKLSAEAGNAFNTRQTVHIIQKTAPEPPVTPRKLPESAQDNEENGGGGGDGGKTQERMQELISNLQDVHDFLRDDPSISVQRLWHEKYGKFLRVDPLRTDPRLVDDAGVRLNLYCKDEKLYAETLSYARKCLKKSRLYRVRDLETVVQELTTRFRYCEGLPTEYVKKVRKKLCKVDIKKIFIHEFNQQIVIRSSKCKWVVDSKAKDSASFKVGEDTDLLVQASKVDGDLEELQRCTSCESMSATLLNKYITQPLLNNPIIDLKVEDVKLSHTDINTECRLAPDDYQEDHLMDNKKLKIETDFKRPSPDYPDEENGAAASRKKFRCNNLDCLEMFPSRQALKEHVVIHKSELDEAADQKYQCTYCEKVFNSRRKLDNHVRRHRGKTENRCDECDKVFNKANELRIHYASVHSLHRGFLCNECGAAFKGHSALIDHTKRTHLKIKQHTCEFCSKKFFSRKDYFEHTRTHTGEKPHQCQLCGKCFSRSYHLKRHSDNVHKYAPGVPDVTVETRPDGKLVVEIGKPKKARKKVKVKSQGGTLRSTAASEVMSPNAAVAGAVISSSPSFQAVEGGRFVAEVGGGGGGRLKAVVGEDPLDLALRITEEESTNQHQHRNQKERDMFLERHHHLLERLQARTVAGFSSSNAETTITYQQQPPPPTALDPLALPHQQHHQQHHSLPPPNLQPSSRSQGQQKEFVLVSEEGRQVGPSQPHKILSGVPNHISGVDGAKEDEGKEELEKTGQQTWIFYDA